MLTFVAKYQQSGHEMMGVYQDKEEPMKAAAGIEKLLDQWGRSATNFRTLQRHLVDYPKSELAGAHDRFVSTVRDYGYRPVTGVHHVVSYEPTEGLATGVIASKNLYSSHYFHARLQLLGLYPDAQDPQQTYIGYVDRLLFDDDVGTFKRHMVESGVLKDVERRLALLREQYD